MFTVSKPKPPIILIYAPPKFGKSSFAASSESPVFIQTEDSGDGINVPKTPVAKTFQDVLNSIGYLIETDHNYKTCVIDSVDWLEPLIHKQVCVEQKVSAIENIGYGRGYTFALDLWRQYIDCLKVLRETKGMTIIQIAHSEIKRFENPETDSYDRYQIKLHKGASELIMESADMVLFGNYFVGITKSRQGFNERIRSVGSGERVLYTQERPAFKAGNRFNLPEEIPFSQDGSYWDIIKSHIPYFKKG